MKKSSFFWLCATVAVIALAYSIVVFIAKDSFNATAWVLYSFTMLSFLSLFAHFFIRRNNSSIEIYDVTLLYVALGYVATQLILGGIICMSISTLSVVPSLVAEIVLVVLYVIVVFIINAHAQGRTSKEEETLKDEKLFGAKLIVLESSVKDGPLKDAIHSIVEQQKYGYAALSPEVENLQNKIEATVNMLEESIEENDEESALKYAQKISLLLKERELKNRIYAK